MWIFHSKKFNNRISNIHERALRLAYRDNKTTLEEILHKENSVTLYHKNVQLLTIEVFKARNDLPPDITRENLQFKNPRINYVLTQQER